MAPLRYAIYYEHKQECEAAATGILKYECPTCGLKMATGQEKCRTSEKMQWVIYIQR